MEYMMPGSKNPILEECLADVDKCDIYVLIIGKRYGTIEEKTKLSFTENEYIRAAGKIIIPLIADDKAEFLSEIQTDNEEQYIRFKGDIEKNCQRFIKPFTNPFHLSTQLLLSLYQFAGKKWIVNDDVKYFCDRRPQYLSFIAAKKKNRLNVFTIVGKTDDCPDWFSKRMAKYELGLRKEYNEIPLRPSFFEGTDYQKHKRILISHLMQGFLGMDDSPATLDECFDYFNKNKINNIFINLYLTQEDIKSKILKTTLENFFSELSPQCSANNTTIYYLIIFQFNNDQPIKKSIDDWIIKNKKIKGAKDIIVGDINDLSGIQQFEIEEWLSKYVSEPESQTLEEGNAIANFLSNHFNEQQNSQTMKKVFPLLGELIKIINEKR